MEQRTDGTNSDDGWNDPPGVALEQDGGVDVARSGSSTDNPGGSGSDKATAKGSGGGASDVTVLLLFTAVVLTIIIVPLSAFKPIPTFAILIYAALWGVGLAGWVADRRT